MNFLSRYRCASGVALALAVVSSTFAQYVASGSLGERVTFVGGGTYSHNEADGSYFRASYFSNATAGQAHSGTNPFWFYRGFMVFEAPRFTGTFTPEEFGHIGTEAELGLDRFTVKAVDLWLAIETVQRSQSPIKDVPIQLRLSEATPGLLLGNTGDPETMYQLLGDGPVIGEHTFFYESYPDNGEDSYVLIPLNEVFESFLNGWNGGSLVVSLTMPFLPDYPLDRGDGYELISFRNGHYIGGTVDFYMAPVPEPSTYGLFGAAILGGAILWRRRSRV